MTKLKTVEELAKSKTRALLHPGIGLLYVREEDVVELLTQDRASLHTSLVAAVEGLKKNQIRLHDYSDKYDQMAYNDIEIHNQALDDTLTIINSIFKE